jgi:hypothetical protein
MLTIDNTDTIRQLLREAKVIAVVGHSDKPHRTSYQIAQFLRRVGYRVYPVNPAVSQIDSEKSYASLKDIPEPIDIVNVFRRSEFLPAVVDEALSAGAKAVWAQLGVYSGEAARKADSAGLPIVMDACIKVEYNKVMA